MGYKIIKSYTKTKDEDPNIDIFIPSYINLYYPYINKSKKIFKIHLSSPDSEYTQKTKKAVDYAISKPFKVIVEVKQIYDEEELSEYFRIWNSISRLENSINNNSLSKLNYCAVIEIKSYIYFKRDKKSLKKIENIAKILIEHINTGVSKEIIAEDYYFDIRITGAKIGNITGFFRIEMFVGKDVEKVIETNSIKFLPGIKEKFNNFDTREKYNKVILFVNKYTYGVKEYQFFTSLNNSLDSIIKISEIDEIWIEYKDMGIESKTALFFNRRFIKFMFSKRLTFAHSSYKPLFLKWLPFFIDRESVSSITLFKKTLNYINYHSSTLFLKDIENAQIFNALAKRLIKDGYIKEALKMIDLIIEQNLEQIYSSDSTLDNNFSALTSIPFTLLPLVVNPVYIKIVFDYYKILSNSTNIRIRESVVIGMSKMAVYKEIMINIGIYSEFHDLIIKIVKVEGLFTSNEHVIFREHLLSLCYNFYDFSINEIKLIYEVLNQTIFMGKFLLLSLLKSRPISNKYVYITGNNYNFLDKFIKILSISNNTLDNKVLINFLWGLEECVEYKMENLDSFFKYLDLILDKLENHISAIFRIEKVILLILKNDYLKGLAFLKKFLRITTQINIEQININHIYIYLTDQFLKEIIDESDKSEIELLIRSIEMKGFKLGHIPDQILNQSLLKYV